LKWWLEYAEDAFVCGARLCKSAHLAAKFTQLQMVASDRTHPTNQLRRPLCSPLRVQLVPLGESGATIQLLDPHD
jgi:hypothetical protein